MTIHPQIIEKEGKKEFVVFPYDEYLAIKKRLEDYEDLKILREAKAKEADKPVASLSEIRDDLLQE